jgi:hypothetical protein
VGEAIEPRHNQPVAGRHAIAKSRPQLRLNQQQKRNFSGDQGKKLYFLSPPSPALAKRRVRQAGGKRDACHFFERLCNATKSSTPNSPAAALSMPNAA